jgi:2-oxoglutarate ferredoxin oxidoreductase subunit beta
MKLAIRHKGFAFLNIMSPCVTWRGDDQHKELRAKVKPVAADHDRTNREAALRYTNEHDVVTTGVLYEIAKQTLVDEMLAIRWKAQGDAQPPTRADMLKVFAPAF